MTKLTKEDITRIKQEFSACQKSLSVVSDEVRQQLLILMAESDPNGIRVSELAEKTSLSRPAVSHHLQMMKDSGIVKSRKEGRNIYYYFEPSAERIDALIRLFTDIKKTIFMSKKGRMLT